MREIEDLRRKYAEALTEMQANMLRGGRTTDFTPQIEPDIHIDPYMFHTVTQQKNTIENLSDLVSNIREERDKLEQSLRIQETKSTEFEKIIRLFESFLVNQGVDPMMIISQMSTRQLEYRLPQTENFSSDISKEKSELHKIQTKLEQLKRDISQKNLS